MDAAKQHDTSLQERAGVTHFLPFSVPLTRWRDAFNQTWRTRFYCDTSLLLSSKDARLIFENMGNPRLVPEVIGEVRAKPDVTFNTYLDRLLTKATLIDRHFFAERLLESLYDLIDRLAACLHPFLFAKIRDIEKSDIPWKTKLERQLATVQEVSRSGIIWQSACDMLPIGKNATPVKKAKLYRHILDWMPESHKSWHKYHRERFKGLAVGDYSWADERLVCAAVTEALAEPCVTCIFTDDWDTNTVFFQFTNNVVYHVCEYRLQRQSPKPDGRAFWALFDQVSRQVNAHHHNIAKERGFPDGEWTRRANAKGFGHANLDMVFAVARPGDVIVWHPSKGRGDVKSLPCDIVDDLFHSCGLIRKPLARALMGNSTRQT